MSAEQFSAKLRSVFAECCRVLQGDGLLVFTYHHSRTDGWTALAEAVVGAGLSFVNAHPVKAELSVAAPKAQAKEPIQLDVVLVCRKQKVEERTRIEGRAAFQRACEHASLKMSRLESCRLTLSLNDRRIILFSQFLVEACAGRSAPQLSDTLSLNLTDLDLAAVRLPEPAVPVAKAAEQPERQLVLLDAGRTRPPSGDAKQENPVANRRSRRRRMASPSQRGSR